MGAEQFSRVGETVHQPNSLRFDSQQDVLNFAAKLVEDGNRWMSAQNRNVADRYEDGELAIVLALYAANLPTQCVGHLVFQRVPIGHAEGSATEFNRAALDADAAGDEANRGKDFVILGISHLVEAPKKIIPSLVRFECPRYRKDFLRDMLAPTSDVVFNVRWSVAEGEFVALKRADAEGNTGSVNDLVQGGPERIADIKSDCAATVWRVLGHPPFVSVLAAIRLKFNNMGVWVTVDESVNLGFEIARVFLSPVE
jgi:hypothetical protein